MLTGTVGTYLNDVRRHSVMTREEEHEVAVRFRATGDQRLADRLVNANLRLVIKVARDFRGARRNLEDLVQEGNLGLVQAVQKYDPTRGVKLGSYAVWWIRAYILKFILNNHRLVRIGTTQAERKLFFGIRKAREKLERHGVEVRAKQLAEVLGVTEEDVVQMERRLEASESSLDAPSREEPERRTRDLSAGPRSQPDVEVETKEYKVILADKLRTFGATLRDRDLEIFRSRLFTEEEPMKLVELGQRFGVSRERVRQLEDRLKARLRAYLESELGSPEDLLN